MEYVVSYETEAGEHKSRRYTIRGSAERFARAMSATGPLVYVVQELGPVQTGQRVFAAGRIDHTDGVYAA